MRNITSLICLLATLVAFAQYEGPGFYRVHNVGSDSYICIKGTHFEKSTRPDAFWPCALMQKDADSAHVTDPGSIIYIPDTIQTALYSQGVDTESLTTLPLDVWPAPVMQGGMPTYIAHTVYDGFNCYFRDYGNGMTAGSLSSTKKPEAQWWIEPVTEAAMDSSFLGLKPTTEQIMDADGWYWTTMCCDFPIFIPNDGNVEGAYTITDMVLGSDSIYYAEPIKICGQGDTVPAATPVLFKCATPYAASNKVIPVGDIANHTEMPIVSNLLMGNYFSCFLNHADLNDYSIMTTYYPEQSTLANDQYMVLGIDADGNLAFMPKEEGTYMDANSAWLNVSIFKIDGLTSVRFGKAPVDEPEYIVGDINGDGLVDVDDITTLIDLLLNSSYEFKPQYDVNGDGLIDVDDVTTLINSILH